MTWSIRLKLWGGILVVAALVFALTLLFNQRQSQVASVTASIDAPAATVGSSYGGVVTDLYVRQGEAVTAGDGPRLRRTLADAPHAARAHPSTEHFWPLLVAAGAAPAQRAWQALDGGIAHGVLAMDAFVFGAAAA